MSAVRAETQDSQSVLESRVNFFEVTLATACADLNRRVEKVNVQTKLVADK